MNSPTSGKGKKMSKNMKLSMLQSEKPELLDKKAAQMVEQVRLQAIERENRSSGALLDTRVLHKLDDTKVKIGSGTKAKLDTQKRVESRRGGRGQEELKKGSEEAIHKMMSKGIDIVKTSNYENEELIWATKSSDPNYSKKRRFDNPELQKFKNNLTSDDRKLYKSMCHQALVDLSTKYREEVEQIRSDMDLAGIFHPDANAHRAHCMYLMKLYNGIRADTIEDPILRKIRANIEERRRLQEEDERKQRELIASFENKHTAKKEKKSVAETLAQVEADEKARKAAVEEKHLKEQERMKVETKVDVAKTVKVGRSAGKYHAMEKSKSLNGLPPLKKPSSSNKILSNPSGATATLTATLKGVSSPKSKDDKESVDDTSVSSESSDSHVKGMSSQDTKLFSKLKRGKMAGADPRSLLAKEASLLDEAEVQDVVKVKERSTIVDERTSTWMLGLLQNSQIHKAAEGKSLAPATQGLLASDTFVGTIDSPMKTATTKEDPQRIIPFGEFYDMFKTFSEEGATADEALRALALHEEEAAKAQVPGEGWDPDDDDFGSKVGFEESDTFIYPEETHTPSIASEKFEPTDTLKDLAEADPHFEAYMKMIRRQSPGGQRLFRGKVGKNAKRRPYNPLGQKAVHMTDSRGAATTDSGKGFTNTFKVSVAEDDSSEEEEEHDEYMNTAASNDDDQSQEQAAEGITSPSNDKDDILKASVTGNAAISTTQLGNSGRTSPVGTPGKPGSRGRKKGSKLAGQGVDEGKDMQSKLIAAFDCLQTPAASRLSYMRKYAMSENATNFYKGIDCLSEGAVLALAREQLVQRNIVKLQEGFAVLPFLGSSLMADFMENVPALLSSRAMALCMQTSFSEPLHDPASVTALQRIKRLVHSIFPDDRTEDINDNAMTTETAAELLADLESKIEDLLFKLRDKIADELDDQLQVQNHTLVDWLAKFKPKPVKKEDTEENDGKK